uniref:MalT-like TPR region domain-containing protein n=1 Tax=Branchiostoma floridae TaxID=7739 RepID=C3ZBK5_BRAFL|eukprot:XP_002594231.1 hypothetical protein BRAFLDRAFT_65079 [Branchiostoma floridae]
MTNCPHHDLSISLRRGSSRDDLANVLKSVKAMTGPPTPTVIHVQAENAQVGNDNVLYKDKKRPKPGRSSESEPGCSKSRGDELPILVYTVLSLMCHMAPNTAIPVWFFLHLTDDCKELVGEKGSGYNEMIRNELGLSEFDPFVAKNGGKTFMVYKRQCDDLQNSLFHSIAPRKRALIELGKIYAKTFHECDNKEWEKQKAMLPHLRLFWFRHVKKYNLSENMPFGFMVASIRMMGKYMDGDYRSRVEKLADDCLSLSKSPEEKEKAYRALGEIRKKLGQYDAAEKALKAAVQIRREVSGSEQSLKESLEYQGHMLWLAKVATERGQFNKSLKILGECLQCNAMHDENVRNLLASVVFEQGRCYEKLGKFDDAFRCYDKALKAHSNILKDRGGYRYPQYLLKRAHMLALISHGTSTVSSAEVLLEAIANCDEADCILSRRHGSKHNYRALHFCIRARLYIKQRKFGLALGFAQDALRIVVETYGKKHNKVGDALLILGEIWTNKKNKDGDNFLGLKAYHFALACFEDDHPCISDLRARMSDLKDKLDETEVTLLDDDDFDNLIGPSI